VEGTLLASADFGAVADLDALTICVPTPLSKTRTPDLSYVMAAVSSVAEHLRPGQLVILQSTKYPGTTEEVVVPLLEERSGLRDGHDFRVGYAPERVDPGSTTSFLRNTPKLVAGIKPECRARTQQVYETVVDTVIPVSTTAIAEMAKLHENTFRAVSMPRPSSRRSPTRSTTMAAQSSSRASCSRAWPTSRTCTTRASRRRLRSCACCFCAVRTCASAIRGFLSSTPRGSSVRRTVGRGRSGGRRLRRAAHRAQPVPRRPPLGASMNARPGRQNC